ncbi:hypothetical protein ACWEFL_15520 [Streptomyces sp. NPDC004838]
MKDIAEELPALLLDVSEAVLRETGFYTQPQVHLLAEDLEHAYIAYVVSRSFYRGSDAATAIENLGLLPSVLKATRLIVTWEDSDLRTALEVPGDGFANGMAILDARFDRHTLHWHPFEAEASTPSAHGIPTIIPHWGTPARYEDVELPAPIAGLLRLWREFRDDDVEQTAIQLEEAGYEVNWISPV